jgi:hypothetical protein
VVVSAGGGAYGTALLDTAVRTRPLLGEDVELRVIAGPFFPNDGWERLRAAARRVEGVEVVRQVPDLERELAQASASLSQCGYNTALALLRARVPALVVPFSAGEENEQSRRAQRLAELGLLRVLEPEQLEPARLARELDALRTFRPEPVTLRLDGARESARVIADLVEKRRARPATRRDWLEPVRRALAERDSPIAFFFRDDDAGWDTRSLLPLLELFASRGVPLDLAVIPAALDLELARELLRRARRGGETLRLHQHGFVHINHERTGRKCEFGPARSRTQQKADIEAGRERLGELLGPLVDPIFTPPWNRCTETTAQCLAELGFRALSREARADPIATDELAELPVTVDWFGRARLPKTRAEMAVALALVVSADRPVGVMLHHADLDDDGRRNTAALLDVLGRNEAAELRPMRALTDARSPSPKIQTGALAVGQ